MMNANVLLDELSEGAQSALSQLSRGPRCGKVMCPDAEKLLRLGLAELNAGELVLTGLGQRVARLLR